MNSGSCSQCRGGSLSNDVFERLTSSGSGLFELFSRDFEQILRQIVSTGVAIQIWLRQGISKDKKAHFRLTYVAQKRRCLNSPMACLRTSDATYDNCSIKIWKTRESALKTPQNRRKKWHKKLPVLTISFRVSCLQCEEVKKPLSHSDRNATVLPRTVARNIIRG